MIDAACAILFAIPVLLIIGTLIFLPIFISKQNQKTFEFLKESQDILKAQLEASLRKEKGKAFTSASLQAHERMMLFLERIHLTNLIKRVMSPGMKAGTFQSMLLNNLREEYEHNMSQQLYISDHSWELIKSAKEGVVQKINLASAKFKQDDNANELAKDLISASNDGKTNPIVKAILSLKKDLRESF